MIKNKVALTIERIRNLKGYETLSIVEAERIIHALKEYSIVMYHLFRNMKRKRCILPVE